MPHMPVYASTDFQGKSARGKYGDTVEELDWSVGQILQTLKSEGLDKNTLVIFTSDNGPWLLCKQEGGSPGPLKDGKASMFEGGFRVPCIMWGAMVKPGYITDMASTLDLLPTFCEIAGIPLPSDRHYDGISLLNVLKISLLVNAMCFTFTEAVNYMRFEKVNIKPISLIDQLMEQRIKSYMINLFYMI